MTAFVCGMFGDRETGTTLTVFSSKLRGIIAGRRATDTDIQQTLKLPSLQCRREYHKCIQIYKCINGMAQAYPLAGCPAAWLPKTVGKEECKV